MGSYICRNKQRALHVVARNDEIQRTLLEKGKHVGNRNRAAAFGLHQPKDASPKRGRVRVAVKRNCGGRRCDAAAAIGRRASLVRLPRPPTH